MVLPMSSTSPAVSPYRIGIKQKEFAWESGIGVYVNFAGIGAGRSRLMPGGERGGAKCIA